MEDPTLRIEMWRGAPSGLPTPRHRCVITTPNGGHEFHPTRCRNSHFSSLLTSTAEEEEEESWLPYAPEFYMPGVLITYDQPVMPEVLAIYITNDIGPIVILEFLSAKSQDFRTNT